MAGADDGLGGAGEVLPGQGTTLEGSGGSIGGCGRCGRDEGRHGPGLGAPRPGAVADTDSVDLVRRPPPPPDLSRGPEWQGAERPAGAGAEGGARARDADACVGGLQIWLVSDGEIWTAHGGVNPCGLVVRRGGV
jgi:hypothetical protein